MAGRDCNCNTYSSASMCDCMINWGDILGDPSDCDSLVNLIRNNINASLSEIEAEWGSRIDGLTEDILNKIKEAIDDVDGSLIDPYKIKYKDITVGDYLDFLGEQGFEGSIQKVPTQEKGSTLITYTIGWNFNKPLKSQTIKITGNCDCSCNERTIDPEQRSITLENVNQDLKIVVKGTTEGGNTLTLVTEIKFKLRMYYGTMGGQTLSNREILSLNNTLMEDNILPRKNLHNCRPKQYIHYLFPVWAYGFYHFRVNGLMDNSWVWETLTVTNQYGYQYDYIHFSTPYALSGKAVHVEVFAHEEY